MWDDLAGTVIVVTGGGSGIGRAVCKTLAESDARVVIGDVNYEGATETKNQMKNSSAHLAIKVDVSSSASVNQMVSQIKEHFAQCPFGVVHCAGIGDSVPRESCLDCTEESWNKIISVNLTGTFLINTAFARWMKADKVPGSIVNISSVTRDGFAPHPDYSASKAGQVGLTKTLAQELGSINIRVNAVAPGYVKTPLSARTPPAALHGIVSTCPMRRGGEPEEVAGVCCFLLSPKASSYVTGQVINVAGGDSNQQVYPYMTNNK